MIWILFWNDNPMEVTKYEWEKEIWEEELKTCGCDHNWKILEFDTAQGKKI